MTGTGQEVQQDTQGSSNKVGELHEAQQPRSDAGRPSAAATAAAIKLDGSTLPLGSMRGRPAQPGQLLGPSVPGDGAMAPQT